MSSTATGYSLAREQIDGLVQGYILNLLREAGPTGMPGKKIEMEVEKYLPERMGRLIAFKNLGELAIQGKISLTTDPYHATLMPE
jgi:hypothetical protein